MGNIQTRKGRVLYYVSHESYPLGVSSNPIDKQPLGVRVARLMLLMN